jgi:hypothetical protein
MEVFKCVQYFIGFWKDFQANQKWRFPELPRSQFKKWLELSRPGIDFAEFERAKWFWGRRPSLILGEGLPGYLLVVFIGVLLLFIPKIGVPSDFGCLFLFYAAIGWIRSGSCDGGVDTRQAFADSCRMLQVVRIHLKGSRKGKRRLLDERCKRCAAGAGALQKCRPFQQQAAHRRRRAATGR